MYLKKMEMKGFKSFADKTVIDFKSGISCIIGPNGSGKSNITDALRWVLGEQKVTLLRGSSMKDVIFKGTDSRKPLGRAEISLFFDNTENFFNLEFDEVKITRRLFMSGESEYLINNTKTRLKDIRELIMDTGIGSDGYSIVSQGKINSMITANKDEIRSIFEEAAGITKFKKRKTDAQRKLSNTTMNLERIEDIVFELEKRVAPLKKASKKALEYREYYEELKAIELASFCNQLQHSDLESKMFNQKITDLYKKKDHQENKERIYRKRFNTLKTNIQKLSHDLKDYERAYYQKNDDISNLKNNFNINQERLKNAKKRLEDIVEEINDVEVKMQERLESRKVLKEKKDILDKELKDMSKALKEKEEHLAHNSHSLETMINKRETINTQIRRLDREYHENNGQIHHNKENIKEFNALMSETQQELNHLTDHNTDYLEERGRVALAFEELSNELSDKADERQQLINLKKKHQEELKSMNQSYEQEVQKLNKNKTEHDLLKRYEESYKGYYHSVKSLMTSIENTDLEKHVHGVVGSLMTIEKKYEVAIEIVLGSAMQNVVCNNIDSAKVLINHLKKNQFGRVSFLPLSDLYQRQDQFDILNQVKKHSGYLGKANEVIQCEDAYKHLFNHLLGGVIVVDDYDTAKSLLKIKGIRYKIVTLDGETFSPGGRITGGSFKSKSKGLLSRKRRIKTLKGRINELKTSIKASRTEISNKRETLESVEDKIENLDHYISENKNVGFELKSKLNYLNEKLQDFDVENKKRQGYIQRYTEKVTDLEKDISILEERNQVIHEKITELENQLENQDQMDSIKGQVDDMGNQVMSLKIDRASVLEKREALNHRISIANDELEALRNTLQDKKALKSELSNNIQYEQSNNKETHKAIDVLKEENRVLELKIKKFEKRLEKKEQELYDTESSLEDVTNQLKDMASELSKIKIDQAKSEMAIKTIKDDLWQKYEMSYLEALEYDFDKDVLKGSKQLIKQLRQKIKALGHVNLDAIIEYDEVKDRYEHLSEQKDDLEKAKKSLEKIIRDLDRKMQKQFIKELNQIREYFKEVFKVLFNGGESDIKIMDEDDILESEIKIMAQPPGKKLQTLDLLSGGEKALTAISLLFAILKNKPTPFCVLDEIEAALDDVNVDRFAGYLKDIVNDSQFILITHRKGTMEIADCLYGVTMEEKGVSKIVSLKLEDIEKELA